MEFSAIVGIDVSKLTLDLHVSPNNQALTVQNDEPGFKEMNKCLVKNCKMDLTTTLFAFENTGLYSHKLALWLQSKNYPFVILSGLELYRSQGIKRGKSDVMDARKIAEYTFLRKDQIELTILPENDIIRMKRLLSLRDKLIRQQSGYKASIQEAKRAISKKEDPIFFSIQEKLLKELQSQIKVVEKELHQIIEENETLYKLYKLITSVIGVGSVSALSFIAVTHGFQKFPNARKFACYCGIAPFPYQSGTSIKGRTKVSHLANKRIKALLGNMVTSAIQHDPELRRYYQRRLEEGKNKSLVLNIVKNKIVARVFAVVDRGTPFVKLANYAA